MNEDLAKQLSSILNDKNIDLNQIIDNCTNEGKVIAKSSIVGGIAGSVDINIINCKNKGEITSNGNPENQANTQGTGGIAGRSTAYIKCSSNEGTIKSNGYFAGGILGVGGENTNIRQCYNKGTVEIEQNAAGGIVGKDANTIWNCYNYLTDDKKIKAKENIGGIIGNEMLDEGSIWNCYSVGKNIIGENNGAILGTWWGSNIKIANCFCLDSDSLKGTGVTASGINLKQNNIFKKSITDFKLPVNDTNSVIYQLELDQGNDEVWGKIDGINGDLPYLKLAR